MLVHSTNMPHTQAAAVEVAASSNLVNNPMEFVPRMGNQGITRIQLPGAANIQNLPASQAIVRIRLPANYARTLQHIGGVVRLQVPPRAGHTQQRLPSIVVSNNTSSAPAASAATASSVAGNSVPVLGGINGSTLIFSPRQRESQQGPTLTNAYVPAQTHENPTIVNTVIDLSSDDSDVSSDSSSVSGDETVYYGGYGRCFNCGECH